MFEQSLQSVNPSIALPYWDFTIEGTHFDWTNFRLSSVFSDDWFGQAAPDNVSHSNSTICFNDMYLVLVRVRVVCVCFFSSFPLR